MNTNNMVRLADFLEELPDDIVETAGLDDPLACPTAYDDYHYEHQFHMSQFQYYCGTPSCIGGWAAYMAISDEAGDEVPYNVLGEPYSDSDVNAYDEAKCWLSLDTRDAEALFYAMGTTASLSGITKQDAIDTLRKSAKEGRITWTI